MHITIPAGTTMERFGDSLVPLTGWLEANNLQPAYIAGDMPLEITSTHISAAIRERPGAPTGQILAPISTPMPQDLLNKLAPIFGGVFEGDDPRPVREMPSDTAVDDMAQLVTQLATARAEEKAAKERAEEARIQILARLRERGAEYGTVDGARVVHANTVEKTQFQTAAFRKAHPALCEQFTTTRTELHLKVL